MAWFLRFRGLAFRRGTLFGFGTNNNGVTGLGTDVGDTITPRAVRIGRTWTQIAAANCSLAIRDGKLFAFGGNAFGRTGLGTDQGVTLVPTQVGSDTGWTKIATGGASMSLAIKDGELYSFGRNSSFQTALGTDIGNTLVPTRVGTENDWTHIAAGSLFGLGIRNGELHSWGNNVLGRTGQGTTVGVTETPTQVGSADGWEAISAGSTHAHGIEDGKLFSWGDNRDLRTGLGVESGSTNSPTQNGSDDDWKDVSAGISYGIAIKGVDDELFGWGNNANGRNGRRQSSGLTATPTVLNPLSVLRTGWDKCAAGITHSLAIRNGALWAFGSNANGRTGLGTTSGDTLNPTRVDSADDWHDVNASSWSLAIKTPET